MKNLKISKKTCAKVFQTFSLMLLYTLLSCSGGDPTDSMPTADGQPTPDKEDPPTSATPAPDFSLKSLSGASISLSDFKNKVVVLFFFGNSCPSCKAAAPSVQSELATAFEGRSDYAIVGIDQWDGNESSLEAFKKSTGVKFPLLLNGSSVASSYSTTYDRLVVINKQGEIIYKGTKSASNDIAAVKQKVQASF